MISGSLWTTSSFTSTQKFYRTRRIASCPRRARVDLQGHRKRMSVRICGVTPSRYARADFLAAMKCEYDVGPSERWSTRCDVPDCRLTDHPMRRSAARTRLALVEG